MMLIEDTVMAMDMLILLGPCIWELILTLIVHREKDVIIGDLMPLVIGIHNLTNHTEVQAIHEERQLENHILKAMRKEIAGRMIIKMRHHILKKRQRKLI